MSGLRFETSTGFFLDKSSWIESAQLADGKSEEVKVINNRLTKIRTKIQDIYNQLDSIGEPFDLLRNPYSSFKFSRSDGHRDFLTFQGVQKIQGKELAIPRMQLVRDTFVFACYTGLSYVDISKLSSRNIQKGNDGNEWIIIDRTKTESRCRIPIIPVAQKIMEKYKDHPVTCSRGRILVENNPDLCPDC